MVWSYCCWLIKTLLLCIRPSLCLQFWNSNWRWGRPDNKATSNVQWHSMHVNMYIVCQQLVVANDSTCMLLIVLIDWVKTHKCFVHSVGIKAEQWTVRLTYLAQRIPWSIRRFLQVETQALHFAELKLAISPNVGDSGAQFLVWGDCVRASPVHWIQTQTCNVLLIYQAYLSSICRISSFYFMGPQCTKNSLQSSHNMPNESGLCIQCHPHFV